MEERIITFEDIQKVNETIKTLDVKGKDYALVNERIKAFRMLYPTGVITTNIESLQDGVVVMKATAYEYYHGEDSYKLLGTGLAYEKENSTFINKTSFIENAETSAIGRLLGIMGIGIDTSVASAEEVENAITNQNKKEEITPYDIQNEAMDDEQLKVILNLKPELKEQLRKSYKKDPTTLTKLEAEKAINSLKKHGLLED